MQEKNTGSLRVVLATLVAAGLLAPAPWSDAKTASPGDEPAAAAQTEAAASESSAGPEKSESSGEPKKEASGEAEREWLVDDAGNRYYVFEIDLGPEGRDWMWIGDDKVQLRYGLQYEVVSREGNVFGLKKYEKRRPAAPPQPSAEELERQRRENEERHEEVAASYRVELASVDRVSFEPFERGLPRRGQWRNGFDVADMNGDGHPDIVFGAPRKTFPARPNIFLGDGKGSWRLWRQARYPSLPYDYGDAAVADFNGDGHPDLAFGFHLNGLAVLVQDGKGRFEPWSEGIGLEEPGAGGDASTFSSRAIEAVDWNGDGRPDLLALGEGPKGIPGVVAGTDELVSANGPIVFLNQGDGTWQAKGYDAEVFGDSLALGDFDGDGRLDFATASNSAAKRGVVNLGRGDGEWETRTLDGARPGSFLRTIASGRLNGDEIDDLVVGYVVRELDVWRTGVDVFYGAKDLEWRRRTLYSRDDRVGIYGLATGDLDSDGRLDVVVTTGMGEVLVFLADESGFFARQAPPELPDPVLGCRGYGVRLADLNGDGRDDLIVGFAGERGEVSLVGPGEYGCPRGGSLRAWSVAPRSAGSPPAPSP